MHLRRLIATLVLVLNFAAAAHAQRSPKIWDIPLGTPVAALPADAFVDPACGTRGGPAGQVIGRFDQFQRCATEAGGLREVWFIYDDTAEYVDLARRVPQPRSATAILDQPVILSFLIDPEGRVAGYRIVTDPRADPATRLAARDVLLAFKARYALGACTDLPLAEGETPIDGLAVKQVCSKETDGRRITAEARYYYKPGQQVADPARLRPPVNEFESTARLEVVQVAPLPPVAAPPAPLAAAPDPANPAAIFLAGKARDCPGCELANADLRRRDLSGADLTGANLEGALLHRALLRGTRLAGANLRGANLNRTSLAFAILTRADLSDAMLYAADAPRAELAGADLRAARLGRAELNFANLSNAKLEGADLGGARFNAANLAGADLDRAYAQLALFFRADLSGLSAAGADFSEAVFRGSQLNGARLREANLFKADLSGTNLAGADFRGARLLSAILAGAALDGASFAGALMPDNTAGP